jgi:lysylphosphatidylglycerol synthetase-like protein (DUF2156 family)
MLKWAFTVLALPTGSIATIYLLLTLVGAGPRPKPVSESFIVALASLAVLGLLALGTHLAWRRQAAGLACAVVLLSWLVFAGTLLIHGLMNNRSWQ